jgi:hypothetical protein
VEDLMKDIGLQPVAVASKLLLSAREKSVELKRYARQPSAPLRPEEP